jgi:hypothetical protein
MFGDRGAAPEVLVAGVSLARYAFLRELREREAATERARAPLYSRVKDYQILNMLRFQTLAHT